MKRVPPKRATARRPTPEDKRRRVPFRVSDVREYDEPIEERFYPDGGVGLDDVDHDLETFGDRD
jgi:hypothetical protein